MTDLTKFANTYIPVKFFLSSYRALSDGRIGIRHLEERLEATTLVLSEWKVMWFGTCAVLRTAIDLFQIDAKSCLDTSIRDEVASEWKCIKAQKTNHTIFWEFLKRERDNVVHGYQWQAYETWMKPDGTFRPAQLSILALGDDGARPVLLMRSGPFEGRNSLELLREGADWVEARIFAAIRRAGFDPNEERGLSSFQPRPMLMGGILGS